MSYSYSYYQSSERARRLLLSFLSTKQRLDLLAKKEFQVRGSSGDTFVIHATHDTVHVRRVKRIGVKRKTSEHYCVHTREYAGGGWRYDFFPYDQALAFLLMIETNQDEFLQTANREPPF